MITLVQRVKSASVLVEHERVGAIDKGLLLFVGVERGDSEDDARTTAKKVANLRIFPGTHPMDRSVIDVQGAVLVVSQFTLAGTITKGNRPSFERSEHPDAAETLYTSLAKSFEQYGLPVATGRFGADMLVELVNDGPVTFVVSPRGGKLVR